MSETAAIVVSHNGRTFLERCLPCLFEQSIPFADILVVDNGSSDGTPDWLKKDHPAVKLLQLHSNRGFSAGVNHALQWVIQEHRYDCVALVNNDVYLERHWHAEARLTLLSGPRFGSCATCMLQEKHPELVDSGGIEWVKPGRAENYLSGQCAPSEEEPAKEIFGASAAAAIYRTALFREVGLFDESLFAYQEDVDLALRAQAAGWRCMFTPRARGMHTGHGSNRAFPLNGTWADYYNARNRFCVLAASLPGSVWRSHWRTILAGEAAALLASFREHRASATLLGFIRGMSRLPAVLLKRYRTSE